MRTLLGYVYNFIFHLRKQVTIIIAYNLIGKLCTIEQAYQNDILYTSAPMFLLQPSPIQDWHHLYTDYGSAKVENTYYLTPFFHRTMFTSPVMISSRMISSLLAANSSYSLKFLYNSVTTLLGLCIQLIKRIYGFMNIKLVTSTWNVCASYIFCKVNSIKR